MSDRPLHVRPRRWPWVIGAAVVAAAVIVGVVVSSNGTSTDPRPRQDAASSARPSAPVAGDSATGAGTAPTGCLGGAGLGTDMLLAAQAAAPHTSNGAVEVAAAIMRWSQRAPMSDEADINRMEEAVIAEGAVPEFRDMSAGFAEHGPNYPSGVEAGQTFSMTVIGGMWHLEEAAEDRAVVTVGGRFIVDGALRSNHQGTITLTLVWEDDVWKLLSAAGQRSWDELSPIGRTFTGEC